MPTGSELDAPALAAEAASGREAVLAELRRAQQLIVVTHERPDGDALGSLVAMQAGLTALCKDSVMFIAAEEMPLPYEYGFLAMDGLITQPPDDLGERIAVFLDCGNIDRNPAAAALCPATGPRQILNIDHHHDNTRFGACNYVDSGASCTAEMVWGLLHALGVTLTPPIADALYVGLVTDTGCFMYENTSPRAHRMAAELIASGVDVHGIYRRVYEGVPLGKLALLARGLDHVERYDDGRLTVSQLSAEDFDAAAAQESYSEGVIDHLRAVRGTAMAALARDRLAAPGEAQTDDGARVRKVSLRSGDARVDVSAIARELGGGGHRAAAGFTTALPWDQLVSFLRERLDDQLREP